jgi:alginate O-acetyltransferase complex protein AlgI
MLFNSLAFVAFAAIFFPLYFMSRGRLRVTLCLVASYFFYGWWDWRFLSLIVISTVIDSFVGRRLAATEDPRARRLFLTLSVCANLGILGFFKYFNFFAESLVDLFRVIGFAPDAITLKIILPVGISFYTFQTMSYTIDIFRRKLDPEPSLLNFAAYVALFPQLVAGPIVRASTLLPQFRNPVRFDWPRIVTGLELIALGYFMKVVVADNLAPIVDMRFGFPEDYGASSLFVGVLFFSFQIYGDFAGYSLIAIGLGRIMGFDFGRNFNSPYFSQSFSEFWTRWHISLSSWLRDYLYISLGGNRGGTFKTYRNLMTTMLLGGLWHGANWTFVIWGLIHGLYLVAQRILSPAYERFCSLTRLPRLASSALLIFAVFMLTQVAWVFFRADSVGDAMMILGRIASGAQDTAADPSTGAVAQGFVLIAILLVIEACMTIESLRSLYHGQWWMRLAAVQSLCWATLLFGSFTGQTFIYFDF